MNISVPQQERNGWLLAIGLWKLAKTVLLLAAGVAALMLRHRNLGNLFLQLVNLVRVDPDNRMIHYLLAHLLQLNERTLERLSIGSFIYAGLYLAEGIGLVLGKTWAEWLTVINTFLLIPLELYLLFRRVSWLRVSVLALNLLILFYLITVLWHKMARHQKIAKPA